MYYDSQITNETQEREIGNQEYNFNSKATFVQSRYKKINLLGPYWIIIVLNC